VTSDPPPVRCHIVTGKGGTGKTTVAAALALALAADGHTTLLVETEGRQGIAQLFDTSTRRCWSTSSSSTR
jgi:anion-transporting  ArsA/GET3 family ATPase